MNELQRPVQRQGGQILFLSFLFWRKKTSLINQTYSILHYGVQEPFLALMMHRCCTVSVETQISSRIIPSTNTAEAPKTAEVFPDWFWRLCWDDWGGKEGKEAEERGEANSALGEEQSGWVGEKMGGEGEEMSWDSTFQRKTIIKLIAWQSESGITAIPRLTGTFIPLSSVSPLCGVSLKVPFYAKFIFHNVSPAVVRL